MNISTYRKRIVVAILIFLIITFLVFRTDLPKQPNLFVYNLINIYALHFIGLFWGIFFLSSSILLNLLISLSLNLSYLINIPLILFIFFIGDSNRKKTEYYGRMNDVAIEEIRGNINLLTSEYSRHRQESLSLEKKLQRHLSLREMTTILSAIFSVEEISRFLVDRSYEVIGKCNACLFFLVDTERQELGLYAIRVDESAERIKEKKGDIFDQWVLKQRKSLLVEDIKKDFRFNIENLNGVSRRVRSLVACPLISDKKVTGVIRLESKLPGNFSVDDLRLLDIISDLGSVSIVNAQFYRKTFELAITDSLTGLYLRRYFLERLNEELQRALQIDRSFALLMLDIDNLKNYNDIYGHAGGDIVLKKIADILRSLKEEGDIVSRYGGEEFSVILPQTSKKEAYESAERIRKKIKHTEILLRRQKTMITASMGIAIFPEDAKSCEELIMKADEALYKAKRQGRDRVVLYDTLPIK